MLVALGSSVDKSAWDTRSIGLCLFWFRVDMPILHKIINMIRLRTKLKMNVDAITGSLTILDSISKRSSYSRIFFKKVAHFIEMFHTFTCLPKRPCISMHTRAKFDWALQDICHSSWTSMCSMKHICLFRSGLRILDSPKWSWACGWTQFILYQEHERFRGQ